MEKPYLLHMFTATAQASPFDVNMAYDAGYTAVIPYTGVALADIGNLTQDAIFSRGPKGVRRTGIFIGGREIGLAADMLDAARKAMVPPFAVSVFADPSGAFTTAAAMVACVERQLAKAQAGATTGSLDGSTVIVLGGTGPVGAAAAALAAGAGARVSIAGHTGVERAQGIATAVNARYGTRIEAIDGSSPAVLAGPLATATVVLACAKAGVQVLGSAQLAKAAALKVAADVNAVPPAGIEGIGVMDDGIALASAPGKAVGVGALAIGNVKYQVQSRMLKTMLEAEQPLYLGLREAFASARQLVA